MDKDTLKIIEIYKQKLSEKIKDFNILTPNDGSKIYVSRTEKVNVKMFKMSEDFFQYSIEKITVKYRNGQRSVPTFKQASAISMTNSVYEVPIHIDEMSKEQYSALDLIYVIKNPLRNFFKTPEAHSLTIGKHIYPIGEFTFIEVKPEQANAMPVYIQRGFDRFVAKDTLDTFGDLMKEL